MIPWYVPLLISLVLVTVFPTISTWLPGLMLGR
jgi:TRAP-type C4-dicarboxylate transport system permease large subunit